MARIRAVIFDYDGVFTLDDYTEVINAFQRSSGLDREEISRKIREHERKWVLAPDSRQFLIDLKKEFNFSGKIDEIACLLNQRGDSGLYDELPKFKAMGLSLSILSNQIAYRVPHIRRELEDRFGIKNFDKIWFSPEVGLQKPFVGVKEGGSSYMDVSKVNIFPLVVSQMRDLGYSPEECVCVDDSQKNAETAEEEGLNGLVFKNVEQMKREFLKKYDLQI